MDQINKCCDYIEEVKTTNIKPNKNSESSAYLNQSRFTFRICGISLPQDQTGSVYFFMSQKDTYYVHIGSTLCMRNTLRKYNPGEYASGTDIAMHSRPFLLIAYIFGFRKDRQIIECTKYLWIDQNHHDVLQWSRNAQNIIRHDNEFKFIYLLRE